MYIISCFVVCGCDIWIDMLENVFLLLGYYVVLEFLYGGGKNFVVVNFLFYFIGLVYLIICEGSFVWCFYL